MNEMRRPEARDAEATGSNPADPIARMSEMLMTQALSLDAMFAELVGYAAENFEEWPGPTERYMRLALRAQSNCRASLDSVARADRAQRQARASDGA
ncbi:hypothetical protein [Rhizorhabdus argentea]|uniref:hypothetical protein n=1 Tax=Rhizorhabdus argentea TaxID=1387174 RepID=UPI0030EB9832